MESGVLGPGVLRRARVRVLGCDVELYYRLDTEEDFYRCSVGAVALSRLGDLDCLLGLPVGMPVALNGLTERERLLLRKVPRWAASVSGGAVTRRARSPLHADLVVARGATWRSAVRRAGRFAPYCRRIALVDRLPFRDEDAAEARMEAAYYGIGLAVAGPEVTERGSVGSHPAEHDSAGLDATECDPGGPRARGDAIAGASARGLSSARASLSGSWVGGSAARRPVPTGAAAAGLGTSGAAAPGASFDESCEAGAWVDWLGDEGAFVVVAPAPHSPLHRSPVQWEFAETVYAALRRADAADVNRASPPSASARARGGTGVQASPTVR